VEGRVDQARMVLEGMREDSAVHVETIHSRAVAHHTQGQVDLARVLLDSAVILAIPG